MNFKEIYEKIVQDLEDYVRKYNLKSLILGISGGIDSTVCAALCREVCDRVGIPLIGRSLPIKNKENEFNVSEMVGSAFCNDFKVCNLDDGLLYTKVLQEIVYFEGNKLTPIACGNIQARLRMLYLYNLASISNGIVIDTDNKTENNLGFFTIHGDQGDYKPIIGLWKTEVYELAKWIIYDLGRFKYGKRKPEIIEHSDFYKAEAIEESMKLTPTDGLGISNSDLEQIGAKSYADVDDILQSYLKAQDTAEDLEDVYKNLCYKYSEEVVSKVLDRHNNSKFKRQLEVPGTYYF